MLPIVIIEFPEIFDAFVVERPEIMFPVRIVFLSEGVKAFHQADYMDVIEEGQGAYSGSHKVFCALSGRPRFII